MNLGLLVALAVIIAVMWFKVKCLKAVNEPKSYPDYLLKLARIADKHQYEFFEIAGKEDKIPNYIIKNDWKIYIKTGKLPSYMITFIDEGKEYIDKKQILI
ncbi:MAG: hypothetical protein PVG65_03405 [Candidatus Thorarchaeota archaeon]|jgi:hypothetical protein